MLRMTDLLGRKGESDGQTFPVTEVFFHEPTGRLRYVALGTGGWLTREEVLLRIDRFGKPEPGSRHWPVTLSADHIEEAPTWTGGDSSGPPIHLENWPTVVVGPFGNTTSPLMMWAELAESEHEEHIARPLRRQARLQARTGDAADRRRGVRQRRPAGHAVGRDRRPGPVRHHRFRRPRRSRRRARRALRPPAASGARCAPSGAEPRPHGPRRDLRRRRTADRRSDLAGDSRSALASASGKAGRAEDVAGAARPAPCRPPPRSGAATGATPRRPRRAPRRSPAGGARRTGARGATARRARTGRAPARSPASCRRYRAPRPAGRRRGRPPPGCAAR